MGPLGGQIIGAVSPGPGSDTIIDFLRSAPEIDRWIVVDDCIGEFAECIFG